MSDTPRNAAAPVQSSGTGHAPGCGFGHPTFALAAAAFVVLQTVNTEQLCRAAPLSRSPSLSDFLCSHSVYLGAAGGEPDPAALSSGTSLGWVMSQRCPRRSLRHGSGAGTRCPTWATRRLECQLRTRLFLRSRL